MKKFKFKFERLLNIKKIEEDKVKQELSTELSKLNKLVDEEKLYLSELENIYTIMIEQGGTINIAVMIASRNQISGYKLKIEKVKDKIFKQNQIIEKVKIKLVEAVKSRKIYDKLKENDKLVWKKEFEDYDNMMLDEINNRKKGD